jgi:hypothetical protein
MLVVASCRRRSFLIDGKTEASGAYHSPIRLQSVVPSARSVRPQSSPVRCLRILDRPHRAGLTRREPDSNVSLSAEKGLT